jgi:hypothetical protein
MDSALHKQALGMLEAARTQHAQEGKLKKLPQPPGDAAAAPPPARKAHGGRRRRHPLPG